MKMTALVIPAFILSFAHAQDQKPKGDPPKILVIAPLGVVPKDHPKITLRGNKFLGLTGVTCDAPGVGAKLVGGVRKLGKEPGGDGEVQVEFTFREVPKVGTIALKLESPDGASEAVSLFVDDPKAITPEKEPNDGLASAQAIGLPTTVVGTIGKPQDVDVFSVQLKAGEKLQLKVRSAGGRTLVDPILSLYDPENRLLITAGPKVGREPEIEFAVKDAGQYRFAIIDGHDQGGPVFAYRIDAKIAGK